MKEGFDEEFLPQVVDWDEVESGEEIMSFDFMGRAEKLDKSRVFEKLGQFSSGKTNLSVIKAKKEESRPAKSNQNTNK